MGVVQSVHLGALPVHGARQRPLAGQEVVAPEAQAQLPVQIGALVLLRLHGVEELLQLVVVGVGQLRLDAAVAEIGEAGVADHVAGVAGDHQAAGVAVVGGQRELRGQALGGQQRLVVDHDQLALVGRGVSAQEDSGALVAGQAQLPAAVGRGAVVVDRQAGPAAGVPGQGHAVPEGAGVGHVQSVAGVQLRRLDGADAGHVAAGHAARGDAARGGREGAGDAAGAHGPAAHVQGGARQGAGGGHRAAGQGAAAGGPADGQRARGDVPGGVEVARGRRVGDGQGAPGDGGGGREHAHGGRAADAQGAPADGARGGEAAGREGAADGQVRAGHGARGVQGGAGDGPRSIHPSREDVGGGGDNVAAEQLVAADVPLGREPAVKASESPSRSVTEMASPSKATALICRL